MKIWAFGDSFTEYPYDRDFIHEGNLKYLNYLGYKPKNFVNLLSDNLNVVNENLAMGGACNRSIFSQFASVIDKIDEDDVLILTFDHGKCVVRLNVFEKKNEPKKLKQHQEEILDKDIDEIITRIFKKNDKRLCIIFERWRSFGNGNKS